MSVTNPSPLGFPAHMNPIGVALDRLANLATTRLQTQRLIYIEPIHQSGEAIQDRREGVHAAEAELNRLQAQVSAYLV
jgi:hypothetical protein